MNERIAEQLQLEQERADKLLEKVLVLLSIQGRLRGVMSHHRNNEVATFASDLLVTIEEQLYEIESKHHK